MGNSESRKNSVSEGTRDNSGNDSESTHNFPFTGISDLRIRQLEEDFQSARETISCLSDAVKCLTSTVRSNKDEELHAKMDNILKRLENQSQMERKIDYLQDELEKSQGYIAYFVESHEFLKEKCTDYTEKIDNLRDEVFKVSELVTKSKEMDHLIDTAETSAGYLELFVKDFERIHSNMQEIDARFSSKFVEMEQKLQEVESISKNVKNPRINTQKGLQFENTKCGTFRKDVDEKLNQINCSHTIPRNIPFREDRVSVKCPNCGNNNILKPVKKGHKWTRLECDHFQQLTTGRRHANKQTCYTCGKEGTISDANRFAAKEFHAEVTQN